MAHRALMRLSKKLPQNIKTTNKEFRNLLVLDFEATCVADQILKPQEIIEFPCLVVSSEDWQVKDVFHRYVKPRVHPELSFFCTDLTGITQETVDDEDYFPEVFSSFCQWLKEGNYFDERDESAFVTCGDWDLKVMLPNQCQLDNIQVPNAFKQWINLKNTFCTTTRYYPNSLKDMLKHLKLEFQGKSHCGIDDVHNIVRVIQELSDKHKAQFVITSSVDDEKKETKINY